MISFREFVFIAEEFKKTPGIGIFKNPSKAELNKTEPWVRALGTIEGNLYVADKNSIAGLHSDLTKAANKSYDDNMEMYAGSKYVVRLHRVGNTNTFAVGEAEIGTDFKTSLNSNQEMILKQLSNNFKQFKFTKRNILEYDLPTEYSLWGDRSRW